MSKLSEALEILMIRYEQRESSMHTMKKYEEEKEKFLTDLNDYIDARIREVMAHRNYAFVKDDAGRLIGFQVKDKP